MHATRARLHTAAPHRVVQPDVLFVLRSQGISNIAWALATLGIRNDALLEALSYRIRHPEVLGTLSSQSMANIAWSYGRLRKADAPLMYALATRVVCGDLLPSISPHDLANTAWAFAKLQVHLPFFMPGLWHRAKQLADSMNGQEVTNTLFALACLGDYGRPDLVEALAARALALAETFVPVTVAVTVWACATLGFHDDRLDTALQLRIQQSFVWNALRVKDVLRYLLGLYACAAWSRTLVEPFLVRVVAAGPLRPAEVQQVLSLMVHLDPGRRAVPAVLARLQQDGFPPGTGLSTSPSAPPGPRCIGGR